MANNFSIVITILATINLLAFIWVGIDKKRSVQNNERVPEVYLFLIAIMFASLGVFFGMLFFRHKTRKIYFLLGIGLLIIEQALLLFLLTRNL
jgi:uncharacterized membrane protein YsdA (DUF1294 family)